MEERAGCGAEDGSAPRPREAHAARRARPGATASGGCSPPAQGQQATDAGGARLCCRAGSCSRQEGERQRCRVSLAPASRSELALCPAAAHSGRQHRTACSSRVRWRQRTARRQRCAEPLRLAAGTTSTGASARQSGPVPLPPPLCLHHRKPSSCSSSRSAAGAESSPFMLASRAQSKRRALPLPHDAHRSSLRRRGGAGAATALSARSPQGSEHGGCRAPESWHHRPQPTRAAPHGWGAGPSSRRRPRSKLLAGGVACRVAVFRGCRSPDRATRLPWNFGARCRELLRCERNLLHLSAQMMESECAGLELSCTLEHRCRRGGA
jgi:hypothetical protein